MPNDNEAPDRLLPAGRLRELLTQDDPDYGKDFPEEEWERMEMRVEMFARLLWDISQREEDKEG